MRGVCDRNDSRPALWACAFIVAAATGVACGPKSAPPGPGVEPLGQVEGTGKSSPAAARPLREVLIGEMCPKGAAGRPAVAPVFLRRLGWESDPKEVARPLESRAARQFSVHRWDGSRAGLFSVAGTADVGLERGVAIGAYAGASPCATGVTEVKSDDPMCVAAQGHCGVAVAVLEQASGLGARPFEEDPDPISLPVSGACAVDGMLLVDIDGDGSAEAFPVERFLNSVRAPAEEVSAVPRAAAKCKPRFASRNIIPPGDPRHWRGLDLLAVIDVDGDGRFELLVTYHYSDRRTWAVYSATSKTGRLDLVGESVPWPRP